MAESATSTDAQIDGYLTVLFGHSEPGQTIHHLLVAATEPGVDRPDVSVFGILPTEDVNPEEFIAQTIAVAILEAMKAGRSIHFAGLAVEAHAVFYPDDGNEVTENLARRLHADHKLQEHPEAVEVTRLYAAARDGRRWVGEHFLTGPYAGRVSGPTVVAGRFVEVERGLHQRLVRAAVGIEPIPGVGESHHTDTP